ncbi:MAG: hypothetical protein HC902_10160 [Calothrix sp. SM1_5_4]|nr:hypothetical protein [Calothrix sp. SM1_5_4]
MTWLVPGDGDQTLPAAEPRVINGQTLVDNRGVTYTGVHEGNKVKLTFTDVYKTVKQEYSIECQDGKLSGTLVNQVKNQSDADFRPPETLKLEKAPVQTGAAE